jgi:hypothetical protein
LVSMPNDMAHPFGGGASIGPLGTASSSRMPAPTRLCGLPARHLAQPPPSNGSPVR